MPPPVDKNQDEVELYVGSYRRHVRPGERWTLPRGQFRFSVSGRRALSLFLANCRTPQVRPLLYCPSNLFLVDRRHAFQYVVLRVLRVSNTLPYSGSAVICCAFAISVSQTVCKFLSVTELSFSDRLYQVVSFTYVCICDLAYLFV